MEKRRDSATAYIILADGFETIEALTPLDVLRRCGVEVTTISLNQTRAVRSSHGVTVEADATMEDFMHNCNCCASGTGTGTNSSIAGSSTSASSTGTSTTGSRSTTAGNAGTSSSAGSSTTASSAVRQALILPGGYPGYKNLCESAEVGALITQFHKEGKLLCAICGAPTALKANQICRGAAITCHTSVKEELSDYYSILSSAVVKYMNIITGMGAGRSLDFAFAIAESLTSKEKVEEIKAKMEII
ncbi:MAG: DJ-1/PfpI family protein [Candidatus Egerieousia sp.]|nr:DJ-1/PfpI family protein [Candidatus Egerieousia sp.]MDY3293227.1 DJ-1/PfpI family protein [Candidatus Egerieousia sp.]